MWVDIAKLQHFSHTAKYETVILTFFSSIDTVTPPGGFYLAKCQNENLRLETQTRMVHVPFRHPVMCLKRRFASFLAVKGCGLRCNMHPFAA